MSAFDPPPQQASVVPAPGYDENPNAGGAGAPGSGNASVDERERRRKERQAAFQGPHPPNWPRCRPMIYHSIADEIEVPLQRTVRALYYSWFYLIVCCAMNCIACLLLLTSGASINAGSDFGWSILYLFLLPPASFLLWYRPCYNAFMKDSSMYFYLYFIFNGFHIVFLIYMLIGLTGTGCAGFVNMIALGSYRDSNGDAKIGEIAIFAVALVLWGICLAIDLTLFFRIRLHYRRRGHSFQEARSQALTRAANSDAGRAAISSATSAAATAAVQTAATGYARQYDEV